jgi:MFS family permease
LPAATFAALRFPTFRIYLAGYAAASSGAWMRSVAQDWLVLQLTRSPTAVGVTMACQFLPVLLFGLQGGLVADRCSRRSLLLITEASNACLAGLLAVLTITGRVEAVQVDLIALAGGLVLVIDNPARQAFVNEIVPAPALRNAVALAAATFQMTRLVAPAVAGLLIDTVGTGWVFAATAVCSLGPLSGLALFLRPARLQPASPVARAPGQLRSAMRHVAARPTVAATIVLVGVLGTFGLNFPVVLTGMADSVFAGGFVGGGAALYGLFNITLAVGSVGGALIAGGRTQSPLWMIAVAAAGFGLAQLAAGLAPGLTTFLAAIALMGAANLAFQAVANASVQMGVDAAMRGRVMGLYMLAFTGGTPLGAPLIGWITSTWGPRVGMAVCGVVPLAAALAVLFVVVHARAGRRRDRAAAPWASVGWLLPAPLRGRRQHGPFDGQPSLRAGQLLPFVSKSLSFAHDACVASWGRLDRGSDQHRNAQKCYNSHDSGREVEGHPWPPVPARP